MQDEPFQMRQTLKGNIKLDIEGEKNLMERKLDELNKAEKVDEKTIKSAMKEYGMRRLANILIVYLLHVFLQRFNYLRTLCVDLTFPCWCLSSSFSLMYNDAKIRAKLYGCFYYVLKIMCP